MNRGTPATRLSRILLAGLRYTPPTMALAVAFFGAWISAAAITSVTSGLGLTSTSGIVPPPPAWSLVALVDGTMVTATAVAVTRRRLDPENGWHGLALGTAAVALILSSGLNAMHTVALQVADATRDPAAVSLGAWSVLAALVLSVLVPAAVAVAAHLAFEDFEFWAARDIAGPRRPAAPRTRTVSQNRDQAPVPQPKRAAEPQPAKPPALADPADDPLRESAGLRLVPADPGAAEFAVSREAVAGLPNREQVRAVWEAAGRPTRHGLGAAIARHLQMNERTAQDILRALQKEEATTA